jgi:hypothetical protein
MRGGASGLGLAQVFATAGMFAGSPPPLRVWIRRVAMLAGISCRERF